MSTLSERDAQVGASNQHDDFKEDGVSKMGDYAPHLDEEKYNIMIGMPRKPLCHSLVEK